MKNNKIFRTAVAFFYVIVMVQVLLLQSIHHIVEHNEVSTLCMVDDVHFHTSEHEHSTCDLCLFQFKSFQLETCLENLLLVEGFIEIAYCFENEISYHVQNGTTYLRGPPAFS